MEPGLYGYFRLVTPILVQSLLVIDGCTTVKWTGEVEDNMDFAAFPNCESSLQDPESQHFMSRVVTMEELDVSVHGLSSLI